jgi:solute:Na+ symporter, SSS family
MAGDQGPHAFGVVDWGILVAYAAAMLGIGLHFARRQRTTEEYFVGGRHLPALLVGVSLVGSSFSVISYIAYPGEYVQYGPMVVLFPSLVAIPLLQLLVGRWFIPAIMRLPITSGYELLEARLGLGVRQIGSLAFVLSRLVAMSLILYTASTVLVNVTGCGPGWRPVIILIIGAVTTTYTLLGGIRTVMVTASIQGVMLLLGVFVVVGLISVKLGGVAAWWPHHWERHWAAPRFFSPDLHVRSTLVAAVISYVITGMWPSQGTIQRFLSTRDVKSARRAFLLGNIGSGVVSVALCLIGAALIGFYRLQHDPISHRLTFAANGDVFFPLYASHYLPTGISGLMVASLLGAAMAALSGGINATITVLTKDFVEVARSARDRSDAAELRLTRWFAVLMGGAVILGSFAMAYVRGDLQEVTSKTVDLLGFPIFGLFFLAIFIRFSTPFGAIFGALYSIAAAIAVGYWDVLTGSPRLSFLWIPPIAVAVSMVCGCLFSLLPTRGRPLAVIGGYSVATLAPLLALVGWLIMRAA